MTRLCTAAIVEAAINADDTMTDEHRGAVLATLSRPGDPKLLTVAETAAALRMSRATLFAKLKDGSLKLRRVKRNRKMVFFRSDDVRAVLTMGN